MERLMKSKAESSHWWRLTACVALAASFLTVPAVLHSSVAKAAPVPIGHPGSGFLSNFDVTNDTGIDCQGFDIQIEDVTQADAPYQYYGTYGQPSMTDMTFPDGHTGIDVRWAAQYTAGTWDASTMAGTMDHFGVYVTIPPGNQNLTWLCDPTGTGNLVSYGGTATGNGYTDNTITNPVPQVQTAIIPTTSGETVQQTIVNSAATPTPGTPQDAVWYYRHPVLNLVNPVLLAELSPDFPAVSAMTQHQTNDLMNLVDAGGTESMGSPMSNGEGGAVWVVDTYSYADPATGQPGPYDDAHTALCNEQTGSPNNCANFVGQLLSTTVLQTQMANGGNRSPVNISETTDGAASGIGGSVVSNDLASQNVNANPGNIDCGDGGAVCTSVVDDDTPVDLTAVPAPGYAFAGWQVQGPGVSSTTKGRAGITGCAATTSCKVTATARRNVTARFVKVLSINQPTKSFVVVGGLSTTVSLTGTSLPTNGSVSIGAGHVSASGTTIKTSKAGLSTVKFMASATSAAATSDADVIIKDSGGTPVATCVACLHVHALPSVTSVTPNSLAKPASGNVATQVSLAGADFQAGAKVKVKAPGVSTVGSAVVDSATSITINVKVTKAAATGPVTITITNPDKGVTTTTISIT